MARIVLVQPAADFDAYAFFRLPLMGVLYLGTLLKQRGHEVRVLAEKHERLISGGGRLHRALAEADLVGLSAMTSTAPRAYWIADQVRRARPEAKIVIGGVHPTFCPEEARAHTDVVVRGEAETVLDAVLDTPQGVIEGAPLRDLDTLPVPDLSLLGKRRRGRLAPVSTSRGCPYNCSFCAVTAMFGRAHRFRCAEAVLDELAVRAREGYRSVFFYDDHFAASRQRTWELLEGLIRRRLPLTWAAQVRIDVADDPDLVDLMKRSGCVNLFVGLESVNPRTLQAYRKGQTVEQMRRSVRRLRQKGISLCGMFVLGADADDVQSLEATLRFALEEDLTTAQFAILAPLPGTPVFEAMRRDGRIVDRNWSHYDGTHVVFRPAGFSRLALQREVLSLWRGFYGRRGFLHRWLARYLLWSWKRVNAGFMRDLEREAPAHGTP